MPEQRDEALTSPAGPERPSPDPGGPLGLSRGLRRLLPDFGPARDNPAFRRLLAGGLLSQLGSSMTSFAVVLQIWDLSRSSLDVGLLGLTCVPVLIVGLLGGSLADTVDRRKLALILGVCLMAVSALFAVQAYTRLDQLWLLYLLATVQASLQAIRARPAARSYRIWCRASG